MQEYDIVLKQLDTPYKWEEHNLTVLFDGWHVHTGQRYLVVTGLRECCVLNNAVVIPKSRISTFEIELSRDKDSYIRIPYLGMRAKVVEGF